MIEIIGSANCGQCEMVKKMLAKKGVNFTYFLLTEIDDGEELIEKAIAKGFSSFPIILKDGEFLTLKDVLNECI